ncbi:FAD/NAD(P)-binding protein [Pseudonocardia yunnanensis]
MTAVHLLRAGASDLRVVVFESEASRRHLGAAYSTTDPRHLLNVRAQVMSAFPEEPGHFVEWARQAGYAVEPTDFVPRMVFGQYLRSLVSQFGDGRLRVVTERVEDVVADGGGFTLTAGDTSTRAGAVVFAYGNPAPRQLATAAGPLPDAAWHVRNPWDLDALTALPDDATVVLVGSGLTAVDAAITLLEDAPRRRVVMVSRHGELPRTHLAQALTDWVSPIPPLGPLTADGLAELIRTQIEVAARQGVNWRAVIDGLRAATPSIWARLDLDERRRFLTAHSRDWDVRRHRMAPAPAARIRAYRASGRLSVHGGGLQGVEDLGSRCRVELDGVALDADALVNCTGPLNDVTQTVDPLLRSLVDRGTVAPDPLGIGLACTPDGRLLDSTGAIALAMYAVGPPRKGAVWESLAVPEIRDQAALLAQHLVSARAA